MKRIIVCLLICLVCHPMIAEAKEPKAKEGQGMANTNGNYEVIYLNRDSTSASFKKDQEHPYRHDLYYSCFSCKTYSRTPGSCSCGQWLAPSFKQGKTWHCVSRDTSGNLLIDCNSCNNGVNCCNKTTGQVGSSTYWCQPNSHPTSSNQTNNQPTNSSCCDNNWH